MRNLKLILLASVAKNNVVQKGNTIPWNCPSVPRYFTKLINGDPVIYNVPTYLSTLNRKIISGSRNVLGLEEHDTSKVLKVPKLYFGTDLLHSIGAGAYFAYDEQKERSKAQMSDTDKPNTAQFYLYGDNNWFGESLRRDYVDEMYIAYLDVDPDTEPEKDETNELQVFDFPDDIKENWNKTVVRRGCSNKIKYTICHFTLKEKYPC